VATAIGKEDVRPYTTGEHDGFPPLTASHAQCHAASSTMFLMHRLMSALLFGRNGQIGSWGSWSAPDPKQTPPSPYTPAGQKRARVRHPDEGREVELRVMPKGWVIGRSAATAVSLNDQVSRRFHRTTQSLRRI
jgi:hypothetical protein